MRFHAIDEDRVAPELNQVSAMSGRCRASGGIAPSFLTSALEEVNGWLHAPVALFLKKEPRCILHRRPDRTQNLYGSCG